jgi:predicted secreted hydrolase
MNQELQSPLTGIPYWEGACRVIQEGKPVGSAYVELTGYAGGLKRALAP